MTARLEGERVGLDIRAYWEFPSRGDGPRPTALDLRDLFDDSVRIRLRSDVPVGTCLSGGIDSPSVAATVTELGKTGDADRFQYQGVHAFAPSPRPTSVRTFAVLQSIWG